jgi:gluconate 2-dehydrogenase gamma chain
MNKKPTRREFLSQGGGVAASSLLALQLPLIMATGKAAAAAAAAGTPFEHLSPTEAVVLAAVADQVFPPDEQPGATDIGAVHFMDSALGGFMASVLPMIRSGCRELDDAARLEQGVAFAALPFDAQTRMLKAREETAFFGTLHFLTVAGVFSSPKYGGNRDQLGWQLIGFRPQHAWQPPFGYYDAQYRREHDHASA